MQYKIAEMQEIGNYIQRLIDKEPNRVDGGQWKSRREFAGCFSRFIIKEKGILSEKDFDADNNQLYLEEEKERMYNNLNKWCKGNGLPGHEYLYYLAKFFNVSMENILTAGEDRSIKPDYITYQDIAYDKENWKELYDKAIRQSKYKEDFIVCNHDIYGKFLMDYCIEADNEKLFDYLMSREKMKSHYNNINVFWYIVNKQKFEYLEEYRGDSFTTEQIQIIANVKKVVLWEILFNKPIHGCYKTECNIKLIKNCIDILIKSNNNKQLAVIFNLLEDYYKKIITIVRNKQYFALMPFNLQNSHGELIIESINKDVETNRQVVIGNYYKIEEKIIDYVDSVNNQALLKTLKKVLTMFDVMKSACRERQARHGYTKLNLHINEMSKEKLIKYCVDNTVKLVSMPLLNDVTMQKELKRDLAEKHITYSPSVEIDFDIDESFGLDIDNAKGSIIGYNIDVEKAKQLLKEKKQKMSEQCKLLINRLSDSGYNISEDDFKHIPYITELDIVDMLIEKEIVTSRKSAYEKVLSKFPKFSIAKYTIKEALSLINSCSQVGSLTFPRYVSVLGEKIQLNDEQVTKYISAVIRNAPLSGVGLHVEKYYNGENIDDSLLPISSFTVGYSLNCEYAKDEFASEYPDKDVSYTKYNLEGKNNEIYRW